MLSIIKEIDKKKEEKAALVKSYNEVIDGLEKRLREIAAENTDQMEMPLGAGSGAGPVVDADYTVVSGEGGDPSDHTPPPLQTPLAAKETPLLRAGKGKAVAKKGGRLAKNGGVS